MHNLLAVVLAVLAVVGGTEKLSAQAKPLAPGVLKVISANIDARDSHSLPLPIVGLESEPYSPNYAPVLDTLHGQTQNVVFFRDVWGYEFGFLGLRQLRVTLPDINGNLRPENIWYLVYRIRNTGSSVSYEQVEDPDSGHINHVLKRDDENFKIESRFLPHFYLNGWIKPGQGDYQRISYLDQTDRTALSKIREAEDRNRVLFDKVEMMPLQIPASKIACR